MRISLPNSSPCRPAGALCRSVLLVWVAIWAGAQGSEPVRDRPTHWMPAGRDAETQWIDHQWVGDPHGRSASFERIRLAAGPSGSSSLLVHPAGPARVIHELTSTGHGVDRPGPPGAAATVPSDLSRLPPARQPGTDRSGGQVRLRGMVLTVDGRPVLPRIVDHQGEPLSLLKRLGFDVVRTAIEPPRRLLEDAERLGMWLVCRPPSPEQLEHQPIGPSQRRVMAWDLGASLTGRELGATRAWCLALSRRDTRPDRLLVGDADTNVRDYSRLFDVLVSGQGPLGTSLGIQDYATWSSLRPRLALPGTPTWTRIQTQLHPVATEQFATLLGHRAPAVGIEYDQIRLLTSIALATGTRGLMFQSHSPLTATDPVTALRARALELNNHQLRLIEPWTANENSAIPIRSSDPNITGAVLHCRTERARLLIPIRWRHAAPSDAMPRPREAISFVVPGIPESSQLYELTPASLRPLRHRRVTGGVRVTLERVDTSGVVLITDDPLVVASVARRMEQTSARASQLIREVGFYELETVRQVETQLASRLGRDGPVDAELAAADKALQQCDALRASGNHAQAYDQADRALVSLARVRSHRWQQVVQTWGSPVVTPLETSFATLPWDLALSDRIRRLRAETNRLPGGDFEDLGEVRGYGWKHFQHSVDGLACHVELSSESPRSGHRCLRLRATADDADAAPRVVATAPLWVTSPPVEIDAGRIVRIHGWVRVARPITGSVDGLLVVDSLTGRALAERIGQTSGWKEFTLFRVAARSGPVTVTFALSGLGTADIDGVSISPLVETSPDAHPAQAAGPPIPSQP